MHFSLPLVLSLSVGLSTAIDVNAFTTGDCTGNAYATCKSIAPQTCCTVVSNGHGASSGKWYHLVGPTTSTRGLQGYQSQGFNVCGSVLKQRVVSGIDTSCMGGIGSNQFAGLVWYNPSSKRGEVEEGCTGSQMPDIVRVGGKEYCTTGVEKGTVEELLGFATNGTKMETKKYEGLVCK